MDSGDRRREVTRWNDLSDLMTPDDDRRKERVHTSRKLNPLSYHHTTYSDVMLSGASQGIEERVLGPVQPRTVPVSAQPRNEREPVAHLSAMVR
jgi:hypothetical protein